MPYIIFKASVCGASHKKKNLPCQDYALTIEEDGCRLFAVADGHGDGNCPRSNLGARCACETALEMLSELKIMDNAFDEADILLLFEKIVRNWNLCVRDHFRDNPLTDAELAGCSKGYLELYAKGERIEHIYGTTLIAGILIRDQLLLIQQGDGRCVVFDEKANASQPIPWDENCIANITTSMCDDDAAQEMRYCLWDLNESPVTAVFLGTDGVEDSFLSEELMYNFYRKLLLYAEENGPGQLCDSLPETLMYLTENSSGDDISITALLNPVLLTQNVMRLKLLTDLVRIQAEEVRIRDHLGSMKPKLAYLKDKAEKTENAKNEYEEYLKAYQIYEEQLAAACSKREEVEKWLN